MTDANPSSSGAFDLSGMAPQTANHQAPGQAPGEVPAMPSQPPPLGGAAISAPLIVDVSETNFEAVMGTSQTVPVVLVLYSKKSLASKQAVEIVESVARADAGAFQVGKVDVESAPNVAAAFQVQTVPVAFALLAGRPIPLFEGVPTAAQVTELVNEVLQVAPQMGVVGRIEVAESDLETPVPDEHLAARAAEEQGDWGGAVKAWKKVLAGNPSDQEAKVALARARFERRYEKEQSEDTAHGGDGAPTNVASLADSMFAHGDEEGAFNALLDALTATYDPEEKEKLRKQLIGLFPIATDTDAVKSARTRLATHLMV